MTNATVSRLGQTNATGDALALFYKLFTGEVLTAYEKKVVLQGRHRQRNITHGKSAAFANTGRATGRYHTPGTEITGQLIKHGETVITIDDLLIADVFISNVDEAMNHYDVRGEYTTQLGHALARTYDKQGLRCAIKAARSTSAQISGISGLPGGTEITLSGGYAAASSALKAAELAAAIFAAHQVFIENEVSMEGVFAIVRPADYFRLVQNKDLLNKDWGGVGSYAMADLPMIAGIPLVMSNMLPNQLDVVSSGVVNDGGDVVAGKYADDYTKTVCLIMTPDAIGTVNLLDLTIESDYDIRRQGTLFVAKKLCGSGILRQECAIEIKLP